MSALVSAIATGITSFAATNLDDIVILTLLFSQVGTGFRRRHIVTGQYLGFTALVVASLPAFFGSLIIPASWMGLAGLVPVAIGFNRLLNPEEEESDDSSEIEPSNFSTFGSFVSPQTLGVAAVTVANGGDNVGIYMPLFASSHWESLLVILSVFFVLVGVWCYSAYRLTRASAIAEVLARYGNSLVPFILIGLGVFIFWNSLHASLLSVAIVYLAWLTIDKIRERIPSA